MKQFLSVVLVGVAALACGQVAGGAVCNQCESPDPNFPYKLVVDGKHVWEACSLSIMPSGQQLIHNMCNRIMCEYLGLGGRPCKDVRGVQYGITTGTVPGLFVFHYYDGPNSFQDNGNLRLWAEWQRVKKWVKNNTTNQYDLVNTLEWAGQHNWAFFGDPVQGTSRRFDHALTNWATASSDFRNGGVYRYHVWLEDNQSHVRSMDVVTDDWVIPYNPNAWTYDDFVYGTGIHKKEDYEAVVDTTKTPDGVDHAGQTTGGSTGGDGLKADQATGNWFTDLVKKLFQPDPAKVEGVKSHLNTLKQWGPFGLLSDMEGILNAPAAQKPVLTLERPVLEMDDHGHAYWHFTGQTSNKVQVPTNVFGDNGPSGWRQMLGYMVYLMFAGGMFKLLVPKQQV